MVLDTSTPSIHSDIQTAEAIKRENPDTFLIMVGTHVSATPEETLQSSTAIDAVARHEYDYTLLHLAEILSKGADLEKIDGISLRKNGKILHNKDRELIKNLDELPFVSRVYKRHLKVENYFYSITRYPQITLITARGCAHRCIYCVYPQTMHGMKYRCRSIEDVVEEFLYIQKEFPQVKEIFIEDDTLTLNRRRCREFSELMLKKGVKIPWTANSRADVDPETLKVMKAAGCRLLCVGVESGDQKILDNIQKGITLEKIHKFVKDARKAGILIHACFMAGNPGETKETLQKTLRFAKELSTDTAQFFPLMVYPGTKAYWWAKENGYLTTQNYSEWLTDKGLHNCVVSTPELS
ncbi:MAG: radical SAM protein, partial [Candidatus Margulisiibacteriota bacterium]